MAAEKTPISNGTSSLSFWKVLGPKIVQICRFPHPKTAGKSILEATVPSQIQAPTADMDHHITETPSLSQSKELERCLDSGIRFRPSFTVHALQLVDAWKLQKFGNGWYDHILLYREPTELAG